MIENKKFKFKGLGNKLITADLTYKPSPEPVPLGIFVHGFLGFKDWGAWPLAAEVFAVKGIPLLKFNFSHNGTSPENLTRFVDLKAFAENNIKVELDELGLVIDFMEKKSDQPGLNWNGQLFIIGHGLGGGIALLKAAVDERVNKLVLWSSVSNFESILGLEDADRWQKRGFVNVHHTESGQELPVGFQLYRNYFEHIDSLNIAKNLDDFRTDLLLIHGTEDKSVPLSHAHSIYEHVPHSIMVEIDGAGHTFGITAQLEERKITRAFAQVLDETIEFLTL